MEENIQMPDSQGEGSELRDAFQYMANHDRHDQLAKLGRQLLHDQNISRTTVRRWLPWAAMVGVAMFSMGFWIGWKAPGGRKSEIVLPEQQQIQAAIKPDSFVFYAPSGEKFLVHMSTGNQSETQPIIEFFDTQGRLMNNYYQNDTLPILEIKLPLRPTIDPSTSRPLKRPSSANPSPPVAEKPSRAENYLSDTIRVADPKNKERSLNNLLSARRIRVVGLQKTIEPLPAVQVNVYNEPIMRCVFYGDRIRLNMPAKMVEGQPVEIIELQGAGSEDGFYLRIGNQFFLLKNDGHVFDLKPASKPNAFD